MMVALWGDIADDIVSAKRHFSGAVDLYRGPMANAPDYVTSMAFQHAMQAGYTSFEAAMKRLLHSLGEPLPGGADWHAVLTKRLGRAIPGGRPAIVDGALLAHIEDLRRFRHVAMHAYDDFSPRKAALPVEAAEAFVGGIDAALTRFQRVIDPEP